ncbi:hypothetical protein OG21DRAFT_1491531 [Imleria badia]|nr:hypothetical protein OG21DRAFT_1491531 [Imleria badia]
MPHDEYTTGAEAQLSRHELEYKSLKEKLHSVQQDLEQWMSKFSDIQKMLEMERSVWANVNKMLEDTIMDMGHEHFGETL